MKTVHLEEKKRFNLFDENDVHVGEIDYMPGGGNDIYATHTQVFTGFEGKGYAGQLLDTLVSYASSNDLKIVPICSYVIGEFKKNPEKYRTVMK